MNKHYLILLPAIFLLFSFSVPVVAHGDDEDASRNMVITQEDKDREQRRMEIKAKLEEFRKAQAEKQAATLKELCAKMVTHRKRELERLQKKVAESDKYTEEEKSRLLGDITTKLSELATFDTDCANRSELSRLKEQVRMIERKHIFATVLPRLNAQRLTNRATAFIGRLTNHVATIKKHIDRAKAAGCDVTDEEAALAAYSASVQKAQSHLAKAKEIIAAFKDAADPGAKRDELKTEMTAMKDALHDARDAHKKIRAGLKTCPKPDNETGEETGS